MVPLVLIASGVFGMSVRLSGLLPRNLQRFCKFQCEKHYSQLAALNEIRESNVPVPWGNIAVKEWGPKDGKPVLCLHGWPDNVNTFDRLIAELPHHYRYISFDFSGHGLSSHRPYGGNYGLVEYTSDIVRVVEHLDLGTFPMIGHSMGGRFCLVYSTIHPEKVTKVVLLDHASPPTFPVEEQLEYMSKTIPEMLALEKTRFHEPKSYLRQEAMDLMLKSGLQRVTAEALFSRSYKPVGNGERYVPSQDPKVHRLRLQALSTRLLSHISLTFSKDLLLFFAKDSSLKMFQDADGSYREAYARNCRRYKFVEVDGSHYAHIENPQSMGPHIADFLLDTEQ